MNKKATTEILALFQSDPEHAYKELILSGHYYSKKSAAFWKKFSEISIDQLLNQFSHSSKAIINTCCLKRFFDLKTIYESEKEKEIKKLLKLNPDSTSLVKSFFLCLELGENTSIENQFPRYTEDSLEAVKKLLSETIPALKRTNSTTYSVDLVQVAINLIRIQSDLLILSEFLDVFVWADFELSHVGEYEGFELKIPDDNLRSRNPFILNQLKTQIQRNHKRTESHPQLSKEKHFEKIDPKWKTDKGLATLYHAGNVEVLSQSPGTTFIQLDDKSIIEDLDSADSSIKEIATGKIMANVMEQNFHHQYRQALARVYQPNDEIDVHTLHIEIESEIFVTLYDLLCAMSCLIAHAHSFGYLDQLGNNLSIRSFKNQSVNVLRNQNPNQPIEKLEQGVNSTIISHLNEIEALENVQLFLFLKEPELINWFRKVEELKTKSDYEIRAMIKLFSSLKSHLPFNPLYHFDDKFYFSYYTCTQNIDLNRILYEFYVTDKLFNSHQKQEEERRIIGETQRGREKRFTGSLFELFRPYSKFLGFNIDYSDPACPYDFGDLKGEIDFIIYFEKQNTLFNIQIKLNNAGAHREKRKREWVLKNVETKAVQQIARDLTLLKSKSGLQFISDKIGFNKKIESPTIYPLIITDNFYADHNTFSFNDNVNHVKCISYFELKQLLLNETIHEKQSKWTHITSNNITTELIQLIEENVFWDFLDDQTEKFAFEKSLTTIDKKHRIRMKV